MVSHFMTTAVGGRLEEEAELGPSKEEVPDGHLEVTGKLDCGGSSQRQRKEQNGVRKACDGFESARGTRF